MAFSLLTHPLFSLSLSSTTAPVCATGSAAGPLATASTSHGNRNGKNSRATSNLLMAMGTREARVGISQHALESSRFARAQSRRRRSGHATRGLEILAAMEKLNYDIRLPT
ncbi:hypothetical protein ACS0TY_018304 [Phlomoides rotata]